ncbi:MAG: hypothetical protein BECKG1743D_GA0114223_104201 [Candidatus Kentron sp. G]|nr:MAG: hypothetical protein BECKG1743D_GA0114223_104201 [Candidatus Kentron sp. G]
MILRGEAISSEASLRPRGRSMLSIRLVELLRFSWDRRVVLGKKGARMEKDADYKSAIVRPRGRFISGVKVPDRSMP